MMASLRESTLQEEGPLRVSKWRSQQVLMDGEEMRALLEALFPVEIYAASAVTAKGEGQVPIEDFLHCWNGYIQDLREGRIPEPQTYRHRFNDLLTRCADLLYALPIEGEK